MAQRSNNLEKFLQELKRRKVFKVVAMYAGTAFIILQLVDIIAQPLQLPTWTMTLVIVLLCIGFIITLLIAWIYDITPEGIKKTESIEEAKNEESKVILVKRRIKISDIIIVAMAIVIVILLYPKVFNKDKFKDIKDADGRISIAVMPFQNMTNDTIWDVWQDGIQTNLIASLSNNPEELKVRQTESINYLLQSKSLTNYASITPSIASTISQKLDANVLIHGSINQGGSIVRINAQLIDSKTEQNFKSFQIDGPAETILQMIDSLSILVKNFLLISKLEKEVTPEFQQILSATTSSPEAYKNFIDGTKAFMKSDFPAARNMFLKALTIDSNFVLVANQIAFTYGNQGFYDQARKWCLKAYEKRDQMTMQQKLLTDITYARYFETPYEEIKLLKQWLEFDDQATMQYWNIGDGYRRLNQFDKAIPEYEKSLEIYKKWDSKPAWVYSYTVLGSAYHETHRYNDEKKLYKKAEQDFPDNPAIIYNEAVLSLTEGDTIEANKFIERYISILKENSANEATLNENLGWIYSDAALPDKAEEYLRQALSLEPENLGRLNNLAWFLIDKNRNINEGLKLVDKALVLIPDDYVYLDTKGWGLFKQDKYQEALEVLQKSWDLKPVYDHDIYLHLESAKKAVANQKNN
jgi:tetratricopeptide (TPR) repeat protein